MDQEQSHNIHHAISTCFSRLAEKEFEVRSRAQDPAVKNHEANQETYDAAANAILNLANTPEKIIRPRNFILDKASTQKELNLLAGLFDKFADDLVTAKKKLNADAISALDGALMLTGLSEEFEELAKSVRKIALAKKSDAKPLRGAPRNLRAILVAETIATYYHRITGRKPTIINNHYVESPADGPFYHLVVEIFDLLSIRGNRKHYAVEALKSLYSLDR